MREMIIGASGLVGEVVLPQLRNQNTTLTPSSKELDITNINSITDIVESVDVVINLAAYTDVKKATIDDNGPAWKLNVEGTRNVANICKKLNKYLIHISTDSVFPTQNVYKELHRESESLIDDPSLLGAYGYTKLRGEIEVLKSGVRGSILRIAYPFGNLNRPERDYILKLIKSVRLGNAMFVDQRFTPTYLKSLPKVIEKLSQSRLTGTFHWVCKGRTTPYEIATYLNDKLHLGLEIKKGSLRELEQIYGEQPYSQFGGLSTKQTEGRLGIAAINWQDAIDDFLPELIPSQ